MSIHKGENMHRTTTMLRTALLAALLAATPALGAVPHVLTYSGYLKNSSGTPVTVSTNLVFALYTVSSGGSNVWTETVATTPNSDGWFSVVLGSTVAMPTTLGTTDLYLGIQVQPDAAELPGRARLTSASSALAVDFANVQGKETLCGAGLAARGYNADGSPNCISVGAGSVTSVTGTAPITSSGGTTPAIGIATANGTTTGALSGADWTNFNAKVGGVTATAPLTSSGGPNPVIAIGTTGCSNGQVLKYNGAAFACAADANSGGTVTSVTAAGGSPIVVAGSAAAPVVGIGAASATTAGALSAADWNAFNGKQNAVGGSCPARSFMTGVNSDGSVSCGFLPVMANGLSGNTTAVGATCTSYTGITPVVSITVPAAGNIVVDATAWLYYQKSAANGDYAYIHIGSVAGNPGPAPTGCEDFYGAGALQLPPAITLGVYNVTVPVKNIFAVAGPGTYTYFLNGMGGITAPSVIYMYYTRMTATWYP